MELGRIAISDIGIIKDAYSLTNKILEKLGINLNGKKISITRENNFYIVKEII